VLVALAACSWNQALTSAPWSTRELRSCNAELVELQESEPGLVTKVLVPLAPEIASWWASVDTKLYVKFTECRHGEPHVHVQIWGDSSFDFRGRTFDGVHSVIYLPQDAVIQDCEVDFVQVVAQFPPLDALEKVRALHVTCPLAFGGRPGDEIGHGIVGYLFFKAVFTWLMLPWPVLLMPLALWSMARPAVAAWGAFFRRCAHRARRRHRAWRLRSLVQRAGRVVGAFGQGDPCCICLGESGQEGMIALLPCRHSLHDCCYRSWISTDSYPSRELICPLCRRRAEAVGKLAA